jgi:membrane-associated phospholipid phosphatase
MKRLFSSLLIAVLLFQTSLLYSGEPTSAKELNWESRSDRTQQWFFHDLPNHIGNDFKYTFWSSWSLLALTAGTGAVLGIHQADNAIQQDFKNQPLGAGFDNTMNTIANPLVLAGGTLAALGISELVGSKKAAAVTGTMFEALALTEVLTVSLQYATQRTRPDGSSNSFPSGHTSGAFALATVAEVYYGPWIGIPSYALASLVGVARLDSNQHWASDVLAGAIIGTMMGLGTATFHKKIFSKYFIVPTATENSAGLQIVHPF